MSLTPEQRMQLRNTAVQEAVRLVASGIGMSGRLYAIAENLYDFIEQGLIPKQFDRRDDNLKELIGESDDT